MVTPPSIQLTLVNALRQDQVPWPDFRNRHPILVVGQTVEVNVSIQVFTFFKVYDIRAMIEGTCWGRGKQAIQRSAEEFEEQMIERLQTIWEGKKYLRGESNMMRPQTLFFRFTIDVPKLPTSCFYGNNIQLKYRIRLMYNLGVKLDHTESEYQFKNEEVYLFNVLGWDPTPNPVTLTSQLLAVLDIEHQSLPRRRRRRRPLCFACSSNKDPQETPHLACAVEILYPCAASVQSPFPLSLRFRRIRKTPSDPAVGEPLVVGNVTLTLTGTKQLEVGTNTWAESEEEISTVLTGVKSLVRWDGGWLPVLGETATLNNIGLVPSSPSLRARDLEVVWKLRVTVEFTHPPSGLMDEVEGSGDLQILCLSPPEGLLVDSVPEVSAMVCKSSA